MLCLLERLPSMSQTFVENVSVSLDQIQAKINNGQRLNYEDGMALYASDDILAIGQMAETFMLDKFGNNTYYCINRHLNYTNICKYNCKFCGFKKWYGDEGAYLHEKESYLKVAREAVAQNATEMHIVGGIDPQLPFEYFTSMLTDIKGDFPDLQIKAFTAVEILDLSKKSGLNIEETLKTLADAGLDALPGGGAEILDDDYFKQVCPSKGKPDIYEEVHRVAHKMGMPTNCTMLYGFVETIDQRIKHLLRLRDIQDDALATGKTSFQSFIPLPYLKPDTIYRDSEAHDQASDKIDAMHDLKTIAICRLMLDNIAYQKAFWPMQGVNLAQVAQAFGSNDLDGTVQKYTIVSKEYDNNNENLSVDHIREMIKEVGRVPVQRDIHYNAIG